MELNVNPDNLSPSDRSQYEFLQGVIAETLVRATPLILDHVFPKLQQLAALHDGELDHNVVLREVQRSVRIVLLGLTDSDSN